MKNSEPTFNWGSSEERENRRQGEIGLGPYTRVARLYKAIVGEYVLSIQQGEIIVGLRWEMVTGTLKKMRKSCHYGAYFQNRKSYLNKLYGANLLHIIPKPTRHPRNSKKAQHRTKLHHH